MTQTHVETSTSSPTKPPAVPAAMATVADAPPSGWLLLPSSELVIGADEGGETEAGSIYM